MINAAGDSHTWPQRGSVQACCFARFCFFFFFRGSATRSLLLLSSPLSSSSSSLRRFRFFDFFFATFDVVSDFTSVFTSDFTALASPISSSFSTSLMSSLLSLPPLRCFGSMLVSSNFTTMICAALYELILLSYRNQLVGLFRLHDEKEFS
jgi:hypothetical protein